MKTFEIMITTEQGKEKTVKVTVDDQTAVALKSCPPDVKQIYLEDVYKEQRQDRKETRRHISLETSIANGHDFESSDDNPMDKLLKKEGNACVKNLLDKLTDRQKEVFTLYVFEGWTFDKIAENFGVSRQRIQQIYGDSIKKLEKNENFF